MINKKVFGETKKNLIKINILVVCSFLIIFSLFTFFYFKSTTYNNIDSKLQEEYEYISMQIARSSYLNPIVLNDPRDLVYIYKDDRLIYYTKSDYFDKYAPDEKQSNNSFFTYKEGLYTFRELSITVNDLKIRVIKNIDSELFSLKQLLLTICIAILFSIIITYFVALYLTRKALLPIESAWNTQVKFIQDASHELRTPITIVSSKLQSLLTVPNNTINDEVETIADAMTETRRLKKMIQDLLSLSKEDAIVKLNIDKVDISKLIRDIIKDYEDIADIQSKVLEYNSNLMDNYIFSDKNKLRQLILIFVDNAFKYTRKEDKISLLLEENNDSIVCIIKDTGIGIKESEINNIFGRFFRSNNVRNKDIDGSGIGLSIAKMISINLNCDIKVYSKENKGTKFEIYIPKKVK